MSNNRLRLLIQFTIVAIISYAMGCLTHSEIMHFFLGS